MADHLSQQTSSHERNFFYIGHLHEIQQQHCSWSFPVHEKVLVWRLASICWSVPASVILCRLPLPHFHEHHVSISIQLSSFFGVLISVSYLLVVHLKFLDSSNPGPQLPSENEFCGAYTSCAVWGYSVHDKKGFSLFPPIFLLNLCNLDSLK